MISCNGHAPTDTSATSVRSGFSGCVTAMRAATEANHVCHFTSTKHTTQDPTCVVVYDDSNSMPHGATRARLSTATLHRGESRSAGQTGCLNREPRAPNPEVRAPGSIQTTPPSTPAWLWAPYAHLGRLEAAPSPPRPGCPGRPLIPKSEVGSKKPVSA